MPDCVSRWPHGYVMCLMRDLDLPRGDARELREQRVVILRAFMKKTEKTPPAEIELALQRAGELKP